jgi:hypothetical protein
MVGLPSLTYGKSDTLEDGTTKLDESSSEANKNSRSSPLWGPKHVGCCVIEIHGPLQLLFMFLAVVGLGFLIAEFLREDGGPDIFRTISGVLLISVCIYLAYLGKAIYILKAFRGEISLYKSLNRRLKGEIVGMAIQNQIHTAKNDEQRKLNEELSEKIDDLRNLEQRLSMLSTECNGSVVQATQLIERLERNTKLNTSNSIHMFFDQADRNKNGRIDIEEVDSFVESLRFFTDHFAAFKPDVLRAAILKQGGLNLDQVQKLVDSMLLNGDREEQESADAVAVLTPREPR